MIPQETIARVQAAADIVEVVSDFVTLKRKGQNHWACCPFHNEKSPSFSVSAAKGIYKCFGCGKAGDSISFIKEVEGIGYLEAIKFLAGKYGIEIEEREKSPEETDKYNQKESVYILLSFAQEFFKNQLLVSQEGRSFGLSYFKERGFGEQAIETFGLGYSPEAWDTFEKEALAKGYTAKQLADAGLVVEKEDGKRYDRFRGRVMFPIHNLAGRVIAFGARALKKDAQPKYLNSPETPVYHKSDALYGIFQARNSIRNADNCYLVEGYTDVVSMHQAGVTNVVASSGTSLTDGQVALIGRFTQNITILYDGDAAGIKAALRGVDIVLEKGMNVKLALFPEGEDPDSFIRKKGGLEYRKYIETHAEDFILFKTRFFLKDAEKDPLKRAEAIRSVVASIVKIPDAIKRSVFYKECSVILGMDEDILISEGNRMLSIEKQQLKPIKTKNQETGVWEEPENRQDRGGGEDTSENPAIALLESLQIPTKTEEKPGAARAVRHYEKELVRLLVRYAQEPLGDGIKVYHYIFEELANIEFQEPLYKEIFLFYRQQTIAGDPDCEKSLLNHPNQKIREETAGIALEKYDLSANWQEMHEISVPKEEDMVAQTVFKIILRVKHRKTQKLVEQNLSLLQNAHDEDSQNRIMAAHVALKKTEMELAKLLGNVIAK